MSVNPGAWAARLLARLREKPAPTPEPPNAANHGEVVSAAEMLRQRRIADDNDLRWLLADARGRRWLGGLVFERCGVKRLSLSESPTATAATEGGRNVGLQVLGAIEAIDFHASLLIQAEREDDRQADALRATQAKAPRAETRVHAPESMPVEDHG